MGPINNLIEVLIFFFCIPLQGTVLLVIMEESSRREDSAVYPDEWVK
jgi:hypothetical protein